MDKTNTQVELCQFTDGIIGYVWLSANRASLTHTQKNRILIANVPIYKIYCHLKQNYFQYHWAWHLSVNIHERSVCYETLCRESAQTFSLHAAHRLYMFPFIYLRQKCIHSCWIIYDFTGARAYINHSIISIVIYKNDIIINIKLIIMSRRR